MIKIHFIINKYPSGPPFANERRSVEFYSPSFVSNLSNCDVISDNNGSTMLFNLILGQTRFDGILILTASRDKICIFNFPTCLIVLEGFQSLWNRILNWGNRRRCKLTHLDQITSQWHWNESKRGQNTEYIMSAETGLLKQITALQEEWTLSEDKKCQ